MQKAYLILLFTLSLFLIGCGREEKSIGDMIPTTGDILQETDVVNQPELSTGVGISSMPIWVKKLGFIEPNTMTLDSLASRQTRQEVEGYNSVSLVYRGDYDVAMEQAKLIADATGIPVNKDFAMVQELLANDDGVNTSMEDEFKGIVYTNHSLTDTSIDIVKSITVEKDGKLVIDVVDYAAMQKK